MREARPGRRQLGSSSATPNLRPRHLLRTRGKGTAPLEWRATAAKRGVLGHSKASCEPLWTDIHEPSLERSDGAWGPSPHPHAWPASWHWANFSPRGVSCEAWGVFLSVAKGNSRAPGLFSPRQALCDGSVSAWVHWTSERPFGRLCTLSPNVSPSVSPKRKKEAGHAKNMRHDLRFLMVETMGLEPTTSGLQSPRFFSRA